MQNICIKHQLTIMFSHMGCKKVSRKTVTNIYSTISHIIKASENKTEVEKPFVVLAYEHMR